MQELLTWPLADCVMKSGIVGVTKPCEKMSDIAKTLGLGSSFISYFPSLETRTHEADLTSIERHTSMTSFATRCFDRICEIVYPANPEALKDAVLSKETTAKSSMKEKIASIAVSLPRRCIERRTLLRATAKATKTPKTLYLLLYFKQIDWFEMVTFSSFNMRLPWMSFHPQSVTRALTSAISARVTQSVPIKRFRLGGHFKTEIRNARQMQ